MMNLNQLTAISPIDGRYFKQVESLTQFFSEFALIRARVMVEIEYFKALCEIPLPQLESVDKQLFPKLDEIYLNFSEGDALRVKEIEKTTNHDVKAVEYFIKEVFDRLGLAQYKEMIHFGLTSQDINNTATPYLLKQFHDQIYTPFFADLTRLIHEKSKEWIDVPLLAHTHGQPASPSSMGKEWYVFYERLITQWNLLEEIPFCGK